MEHARILMMGVAFGFTAFTLLFSARSAAANGVEPSWAMWKLDLTAQNGRVLAIWHVTVGGDDNDGNPVALRVESMELKCRPVGNAGVSANMMVLQGGHFECDMPDLLEEANKIIAKRWGDKFALKGGQEQCDCAPVGLAYAQTDVKVKGQGRNVIFYHPSIRFAINVQQDAVQNEFHFAGMDSTGAMAAVKGQTPLESRYQWHDEDKIFRFDHFVRGNLAGVEEIKPRRTALVTNKTTVYIGGMPGGAQRFEGAIAHLVVDPGCRVH